MIHDYLQLGSYRFTWIPEDPVVAGLVVYVGGGVYVNGLPPDGFPNGGSRPVDFGCVDLVADDFGILNKIGFPL